MPVYSEYFILMWIPHTQNIDNNSEDMKENKIQKESPFVSYPNTHEHLPTTKHYVYLYMNK